MQTTRGFSDWHLKYMRTNTGCKSCSKLVLHVQIYSLQLLAGSIKSIINKMCNWFHNFQMWPLNSPYRTGPLGWRQCSKFTRWRRLHQWFWRALPWWPLPGNPSRAQQDGDPDQSHATDDQRRRESTAATQRAAGRLGPRQSPQPVFHLHTTPPLPAHYAKCGLQRPRSSKHWPRLRTSPSPGCHQSARSTWQWWKHN